MKEILLIQKEREMEFFIIKMEADMRELGRITNQMELVYLFMKTKNLILAFIKMDTCMDQAGHNIKMVIFIKVNFTKGECKDQVCTYIKTNNNGFSDISKIIIYLKNMRRVNPQIFRIA